MDNLLVSMRLTIEAQGAKLGMDFGPTIGQYGINIKTFCEEFNKVSDKVLKGIPLRVLVNIYKDRTFEIFVKGFDLKFFINYYLLNKKYISGSEVYSLYLLQKKLSDKYNLNIDQDYSRVKSLLHYLKESNIKCIY